MNQPLLPDDNAFPLSAYRERTLAMLRRYGRCAVELGRLPSLLGREFFRAKVTSYTVHTFEDAILFAFDMERSLERLSPFERMLLGRLVLQEYTQVEVGRMLRVDQAYVQRRFFDAVDHLTEIMLDNALLNPTLLHSRRHLSPPAAVAHRAPATDAEASKTPVVSIELKACQEPESGDFAASA